MLMIFLSVVIPTANLMILLFLIYRSWIVQKEKKILEEKGAELSKKEAKIDSDYHKIIDNSLSAERNILNDATKEASSILTNTQYVSSSLKDAVNKILLKMIQDAQQAAVASSNDIMTKHKSSLNQLSGKSLEDFQNITKQFELDTQKQMKEYRETLLFNLQKEIAEYKQQKVKESDKVVNQIVQNVAQKVLNKSISLEDQQKLIIDSLEKSLKEGVFD
jgi:F0F1-type ATP synthase membrane subunit b/b'